MGASSIQRTLEGAIELVNRMLPQDVVAVMGFHRTTVFTRGSPAHCAGARAVSESALGHRRRDRYLSFMARAPMSRPLGLAAGVRLLAMHRFLRSF
jgi:hypothetical protein